MASSKPITNAAGKVLMKHPKTNGRAWFGPGTVAHHRRSGWVYAQESDDKTTQPGSAGDTGASDGDSNTPKENA